MLVGLTGGIGSGKSTVADIFEKNHGITLVDADVVARDVLSRLQSEVVEHFGPGLLDNKGKVDRRCLRDIIFQYPAERAWLEALLHPPIRAQIKTELSDASSPYAIAVIPLLAESHEYHDYLNHIIVVDAPLAIRQQRVQLRDDISAEQMAAILNSQASDEARLSIADTVIANGGTHESLMEKISVIHERLLKNI